MPEVYARCDSEQPEVAEATPHERAIPTILGESRALATDMKEWFELKLRHTQLQVRNQLERKLREALVLGVIVGLALAAGLFLLLTLAVGLSRWTGLPTLGFALVATLLLMTTGAVWLVRKRLTRADHTARVPLASATGTTTALAAPESARPLAETVAPPPPDTVETRAPVALSPGREVVHAG